LRQFYHPIALIDCEWIKANCRVCSITDLTGNDSEVEETKTPAPKPRKTIIESPEVRQGLDSSPYFCNRRQMTASPTPPPQPTFIRKTKSRRRNRGSQSRFHFCPKTSARVRSSSISSASAETPSRKSRFTRKQGPRILHPRARRSMPPSSNNTQPRVLGMRRY
jgi:hypothetical protein